MKYKIIRKPMVLDRVEIDSLKSAYYYYKQNFEMTPYLFNKFHRSKWEGLWHLTDFEITEGSGNFSNSANVDRP